MTNKITLPLVWPKTGSVQVTIDDIKKGLEKLETNELELLKTAIDRCVEMSEQK